MKVNNDNCHLKNILICPQPKKNYLSIFCQQNTVNHKKKNSRNLDQACIFPALFVQSQKTCCLKIVKQTIKRKVAKTGISTACHAWNLSSEKVHGHVTSTHKRNAKYAHSSDVSWLDWGARFFKELFTEREIRTTKLMQSILIEFRKRSSKLRTWGRGIGERKVCVEPPLREHRKCTYMMRFK